MQDCFSHGNGHSRRNRQLLLPVTEYSEPSARHYIGIAYPRADTGFSERWIEGHQLAAAALGKPLVLEEFGKIATGDAANLTRTRDPVYR